MRSWITIASMVDIDLRWGIALAVTPDGRDLRFKESYNGK